MATKIVLTDDIDGTEGAGAVEFMIDGKHYTIDLNEKNAAKMHKALEPYIDAARPKKRINGAVIKPRKKSPPMSRTEQANAIRDWARANGKRVSGRGRIPVDIVDSFNEAHPNQPAFAV